MESIFLVEIGSYLAPDQHYYTYHDEQRDEPRHKSVSEVAFGHNSSYLIDEECNCSAEIGRASCRERV